MKYKHHETILNDFPILSQMTLQFVNDKVLSSNSTFHLTHFSHLFDKGQFGKGNFTSTLTK